MSMKELKILNANEVLSSDGQTFEFQDLPSGVEYADRCLVCDIYKDNDLPCPLISCSAENDGQFFHGRPDGRNGIFKKKVFKS